MKPSGVASIAAWASLKRRALFVFLAGLSLGILVACQSQEPGNHARTSPVNKPAGGLPWHLPRPSTNHAVAWRQHADGSGSLYLFYGLGAGKTWRDISNRHWRWHAGQWQKIPPHPLMQPVLAASAVTVGQHVYVIGGYTVSVTGEEKSVAEVYRLKVDESGFELETRMPVAVDDTVALVYQNRYIYLVSGWHDTGNVNLVQVYDTQKKRWFEASPYPAPAVFGHAGGIWNNRLLICDGVKVVQAHTPGGQPVKDFVMSPECVMGIIQEENPGQIDWQQVPHPPGPGRYRMAAGAANGQFIFAGGSSTPYNYDGMGYNGKPAMPSDAVLRFDPVKWQWVIEHGAIKPMMDFRGLIDTGKVLLLTGGLDKKRQVSDAIQVIPRQISQKNP